MNAPWWSWFTERYYGWRNRWTPRKQRRFNRLIREAEKAWDTRPKLFSMRYGKGPDAQRRAYILGYTDAKGMPR